MRRPGRVLLGLLGVGALVASVWAPRRYHLAEVGAAVLFAVVILPLLTEFELDALGIHATVPVPSRRRALRSVCEGGSRQLVSIARIVGVDPDQIGDLVAEAVDDTARLWRGRVVEETARTFLICRAVGLIRHSLRLGQPYRVVAPPVTDQDAAPVQDVARRPPLERIVIALVDYAELPEASVAAMLRLDPSEVSRILGPPVGDGREPADRGEPAGSGEGLSW